MYCVLPPVSQFCVLAFVWPFLQAFCFPLNEIFLKHKFSLFVDPLGYFQYRDLGIVCNV